MTDYKFVVEKNEQFKVVESDEKSTIVTKPEKWATLAPLKSVTKPPTTSSMWKKNHCWLQVKTHDEQQFSDCGITEICNREFLTMSVCIDFIVKFLPKITHKSQF